MTKRIRGSGSALWLLVSLLVLPSLAGLAVHPQAGLPAPTVARGTLFLMLAALALYGFARDLALAESTWQVRWSRQRTYARRDTPAQYWLAVGAQLVVAAVCGWYGWHSLAELVGRASQMTPPP